MALSIGSVGSSGGGEFGFPFVAIGEQFFFVVEEFFARFGGVFGVGGWGGERELAFGGLGGRGGGLLGFFGGRGLMGEGEGKLLWLTFYDGIDRTTLLAEAAVDAFRHVNVVSCRPSAAVLALFGFNGYGGCRADGFT